MASNSGDSSASRTQFILHRLQYVTDWTGIIPCLEHLARTK
jgi:hypothetical protein